MCFVQCQYKGNHRGGRPKAAPSVDLLGVTLCCLGEPWGPSWGDVGVIWGRLGVPLDPLGLPWGALGSSCRCRGSVWAALGGHAAETPCVCTKCGLLELIPRIPPESAEVVSRSTLLPAGLGLPPTMLDPSQIGLDVIFKTSTWPCAWARNPQLRSCAHPRFRGKGHPPSFWRSNPQLWSSMGA